MHISISFVLTKEDRLLFFSYSKQTFYPQMRCCRMKHSLCLESVLNSITHFQANIFNGKTILIDFSLQFWHLFLYQVKAPISSTQIDQIKFCKKFSEASMNWIVPLIFNQNVSMKQINWFGKVLINFLKFQLILLFFETKKDLIFGFKLTSSLLHNCKGRCFKV